MVVKLLKKISETNLMLLHIENVFVFIVNRGGQMVVMFQKKIMSASKGLRSL